MGKRPGGTAAAIGELRRAIENLRAAPVTDGGPEVAPAESSVPADIEELVARVRTQVIARRAGFVPPPPRSIELEPRYEAHFPRFRRDPAPLTFRSEYALGELLVYEDAHFVQNAYRALLHRDPEADGLAHFLRLLYAGAPKVVLLKGIAESAEARPLGVSIRGLRLAFFMERVRQTPVLGRAVAVLQYVLSLPWILRRLERQERELVRAERELRETLDALAAVSERSANEVAARDHATLTALRDSIERLDREKASHGATMALTGRFAGLRNEFTAELERRVRLERALQVAMREELLRVAELALAASNEVAAGIEETSGRLNKAIVRTRELSESLEASIASSRETATRLAASAAASIVASKETAARLDSAIGASKEIEARVDASLAATREVAARLDSTFTKPRIEALLAEEDHALDTFYVDFEASFRGAPETIRERASVYLPIVRGAGAGGATAPVVDLGCGRGEWLDLLKESGLAGRGVDLNVGMAEHCRALGLAVDQGDLLEHLRTLETGSVGAITAIHVIEHLAFPRLIQLLDESLRVLRPGGVAIFETPNPENVTVGSCNFWQDPSHRHPLPPTSTRRMLELRGFQRVEILPLHPYPVEAHFPTDDPGSRNRLNHLFYGPQDYALVAYKALPEESR